MNVLNSGAFSLVCSFLLIFTDFKFFAIFFLAHFSFQCNFLGIASRKKLKGYTLKFFYSYEAVS